MHSLLTGVIRSKEEAIGKKSKTKENKLTKQWKDELKEEREKQMIS